MLLSGFGVQTASAAKQVCIWKISDSDNTVYLAGSVPLLRDEDLPFPAAYDKVYQKCAELVFATDMATVSSPAKLWKLKKFATLPKGETLENHLRPETITALRVYLKKFKVPYSLMKRVKPAMMFLTVSSIESTRGGAKAENGVESVFYKKSVKDKKPSRGLETVQHQLISLDSIPDKLFDEKLEELLRETGEPVRNLNALIRYWKVGDTARIDQLIREDLKEGSLFRKILLTQHNENRATAIEQALAGKRNTMFLLGTAQLIGKGGIVDLLRKKGLKVEQLSAAGE